MAQDEITVRQGITIGSAALTLLTGLIFLGMWGCPKYSVWQQELAGQAELKRAEQNRKITIEEAEAKMEAAKSLAQAEVERARGLAEAIAIVGKSLDENTSYIRYRWVEGLHDGSSETIYVPTEANLPIMEATRRWEQINREDGR